MRFSSPVVIASTVALVAAVPAIPSLLPTTSLPVGLPLPTTLPIGLPLPTTLPIGLPPTSSLPIPIPLPSPSIPSYSTLDNYCNNAGPNAYVAVQYANGVITSYSYGQCYPYTLNGSPVSFGVFCKNVVCRNCAGEGCTNPNVEVLVPKSVAVINPIPFLTNIAGKGAICQKLPFDLPFVPGLSPP